MTDPIVGIDLGTTNTVVANCDEGGNPRVLADDNGYKIHPSVVSFHPNGTVVVGAEAKQRKVIDPRNTVYSVKRLIGRSFRSREIQAAQARMPYVIKEGVNQAPVIQTRGGEFAVPEISAIVLDHARNIARKALGTDVTRAVVTVPASFNDAQRSATATAGAIAGLTIVRVLNEPTAAALAYGYQKQLSRTIAVYDFGGGTFDVTVLRLDDQVYEVLGTAGDSFLGGDDLDERLVDHMVAQFLAQHRIDLRQNELSIMRLRAVAEQTKIELSRRTRAIVKVDEIAYGPGGAPIDLQLEITRDELVSRVGDIIERTFPVCEEALRVAGATLDDIEDVVLVGGTTKIPHVRDRVTRFFNKVPRTDVNPEEAVAVGAALQAAALERILSSKRQTAKTSTPPPGTPMERRPATVPPVVSTNAPRTTAPRFSSEPTTVDPTGTGTGEEPTGVRPGSQIKRSTAPMGVPVSRTMTERNVTRGAQVDRFDGGGTGSGTRPGTESGAPGTGTPKAIGRITKPGAAPPPIPTAAPTAKTMFGVPAAPAPATTPAPPTNEPPADFDELTTGAGSAHAAQLANFDLPTTTPNFELPVTTPNLEPPPAEAFRNAPTVTAPPQARTVMMQPAPSQQPTMIAPAPPIAPRPAPIAPQILDVTPASFGISTVGGYCEELIRRNSRVPTEMKKLFVTSRDRQSLVRIRVCQGESRRLDENVVLGDLVLDNLEARPRGETKIEVTFTIDASGILQVRARDARTGQEQRASLEVMGRQSADEVAAAAGRIAQLRR
ncbi:MAG TPA: Hsp70 family protein [Kofleriaceae bacterium]|nr:Hsp70 family protein [Kofleriaceae bacterium]